MCNSSVVTQFKENKLTQFFVQNGKKIDIPAPKFDGIPSDSSSITPEFCTSQFKTFGDRDRFSEVGGFAQLNKALAVPMVLVMSIWDDVSRLPCQKTTSPRMPECLHTMITALCQHALARLQLPAREGRHPRRRPWRLPSRFWCPCGR